MSLKRPRLCGDTAGTTPLYEIAPISISDLELASISGDIYELIDFLGDNEIEPAGYLLRPELMTSLGVDAYWMLYINGVVDFGRFMCTAPLDIVASFIWDGLAQSCSSSLHSSGCNSGSIHSSVAGAIVQYCWNNCCIGASLAEGNGGECSPSELAERCISLLNMISDHYLQPLACLEEGPDGLPSSTHQFGLFYRICAIAATCAFAPAPSGDTDSEPAAVPGVMDAVLEWEARQLSGRGDFSLNGGALAWPGPQARDLLAVLHPRAILTALDKSLRGGMRLNGLAVGTGAGGGGGIWTLLSSMLLAEPRDHACRLQGEVLELCRGVCRLALEELHAMEGNAEPDALLALCLRGINCVVVAQQWAFAALDGQFANDGCTFAGALEPFVFEMLMAAINISYSGTGRTTFSSSSGDPKAQSCFCLLLSVILQRTIDELAIARTAAAEASLQQIYRAVRALKRELQEFEATAAATAPGTKVPKPTAPSGGVGADSGGVSGGFAVMVPLAVRHAFWIVDRKPHRGAINQVLLALKGALDGCFDVLRANVLSVLPGSKPPSVASLPAAVPTDVTRPQLVQWQNCIATTAMLPVSVVQLCRVFDPPPLGAPRELHLVSCFRLHVAAAPTLVAICRDIATAMRKHIATEAHGQKGPEVVDAERSLDVFLTECAGSKIHTANGSSTSPAPAAAAPGGEPTGEIEAAVDAQWMRLLEKTGRSSGLAAEPHVMQCYKELCVSAVCFRRRAVVCTDNAVAAPALGYTCAGSCLLSHVAAVDSATASSDETQTRAYVFSRVDYCYRQLLAAARAKIGGADFGHAMHRVFLLIMVQLADEMLVGKRRLLLEPPLVPAPTPGGDVVPSAGIASPFLSGHRQYSIYWAGVLAALSQVCTQGCEEDIAAQARAETMHGETFEASSTVTIVGDVLLGFICTGKLRLPLAELDAFALIRTTFTLEALIEAAIPVVCAQPVAWGVLLQRLCGLPQPSGAQQWEIEPAARLFVVLRSLLLSMAAPGHDCGDLAWRLVHWYFRLVHSHLGDTCNGSDRDGWGGLLREGASRECFARTVDCAEGASLPGCQHGESALTHACRMMGALLDYVSAASDLSALLRGFGPRGSGISASHDCRRIVQGRIALYCATPRGEAPVAARAPSVRDLLRSGDSLFGELAGGLCSRGQTDDASVEVCAGFLIRALEFSGEDVDADASGRRQHQLVDHWCGRALSWLSKPSTDEREHDAAGRVVMGRALYIACCWLLETCQTAGRDGVAVSMLKEGCAGWAAVLGDVMCLVHPAARAATALVAPDGVGMWGDVGCAHMLVPTNPSLVLVEEALLWWRESCCQQASSALHGMGLKLSLSSHFPATAPCTEGTDAGSATTCHLETFRCCCMVARQLPLPSAGFSGFSSISGVVFATSGTCSISGTCSVAGAGAIVDESLRAASVALCPGDGDGLASLAKIAVYSFLSCCRSEVGQTGRAPLMGRDWARATIAVILRAACIAETSAPQLNAFSSLPAQLCMHMLAAATFWFTFRGCAPAAVGTQDQALLVDLHRLLFEIVRRAHSCSQAQSGGAVCLEYPELVRSAFRTQFAAITPPQPASVGAALLTTLERDAGTAAASGTAESSTSRPLHSSTALRNATNLPSGKGPSELAAVDVDLCSDSPLRKRAGTYCQGSSLRPFPLGTL